MSVEKRTLELMNVKKHADIASSIKVTNTLKANEHIQSRFVKEANGLFNSLIPTMDPNSQSSMSLAEADAFFNTRFGELPTYRKVDAPLSIKPSKTTTQSGRQTPSKKLEDVARK